MTTYVNKPNTAILLQNFKRTNDNSPHHVGEIHLDRHTVETLLKESTSDLLSLRLAAWDSKSAKGTSYLSLKVSEPYKKPAEPNPTE
jgi:hypothetical protein